MNPDISLYLILLKDVRDALEYLYDRFNKCDCPFMYSFEDALVSLGEFTVNVSKDISSDMFVDNG